MARVRCSAGASRASAMSSGAKHGIARALRESDVAEFGPFRVESNLQGNSLFEQEIARIGANLPG